MKDRTCASSASEASERKALWCDTSAITPERSLSSAQSADEASPSTGLSVDTGDLKVAMMQMCQSVQNLCMLTFFCFTSGGCLKESSSEQQDAVTEKQVSVDGLTTATVIAEDPHAVLVEFSSVVADTQEYIFKVTAYSKQAET